MEAIFMKYKQFVAGFAICLILLSAIFITGFAEGFTVLPNPYPITLNGAEISVEAYNINGFTFLKLADVGKAIPGTTIKFNEINEVIEINSAEASLPETMDESEVMSMSTGETIKYTPDGIEARQYKGMYTVSIGRFKLKYKDTEYKLSPASDRDGYSITKNGEILIDKIQLIEGTYFFEYDYYCNNILPLLN